MTKTSDKHHSVLRRYPRAQPCREAPPRTDDGRKIIRLREVPYCRWVFHRTVPTADDSAPWGQWKWLCDACSRFIPDKTHFASSEHIKQVRQTQNPHHVDGTHALGYPDPQTFCEGWVPMGVDARARSCAAACTVPRVGVGAPYGQERTTI